MAKYKDEVTGEEFYIPDRLDIIPYVNRNDDKNPHKCLSEQHKKNISKATTGKKKSPRSEETRARMSSSRLGKKKSAETRANMSKAQKGISKRPLSAKTRAKVSATLKNRKLSDEQKAKISVSLKAYYAKKRAAENAGNE